MVKRPGDSIRGASPGRAEPSRRASLTGASQRLVLVLLLAAGCSRSEPRIFTNDPVAVSDVVGRTVDEARAELEGLGFIVRIVSEGAGPPPPVLATDPPGVCPDGEVVAQDPPPDEEVLKASTVVLSARGC